jgi:hypothetical protein
VALNLADSEVTVPVPGAREYLAGGAWQADGGLAGHRCGRAGVDSSETASFVWRRAAGPCWSDLGGESDRGPRGRAAT